MKNQTKPVILQKRSASYIIPSPSPPQLYKNSISKRMTNQYQYKILQKLLTLNQVSFSQIRAARTSTRMILVQHIAPVIIFATIFNITKFISISPYGLQLQKIPEYRTFIVYFQAVHPLTTTGFIPLLILITLNFKVSE